MGSASAADDRVARRLAWVVLAVGGLGFAVAAWLLVPWGWVPGTRVEPVAPDRLLTAEQLARAEAYAGPRRLLGWTALAVSVLVALALALTRPGRRLVRVLRGPWPVRVVLGVAAVVAVGRLAVVPWSVAIRQRNLDFGLTTQSWAGWLADLGRSYAVTVVATSLALVVLVGVARRWRRAWPAITATLAAALVGVGSFVYPVVVEPVFHDFESLPDGPLRSSVLELADREGVAIDDVLVADASRRTTTLNAYVSGIGSTRRVVVYDTLLDGLTREQAEIVVAHELAHAAHDDVVRGTALGALGALAGTGVLALLLLSPRVRRRAQVGGADDPSAVALVLAAVALGTLLTSPVENGISRAIEARADLTSLEATGASDEFVAMQHRLAVRSLSDPTSPGWSRWWFGSHPTAWQRVGLLDALDVPWRFDPERP